MKTMFLIFLIPILGIVSSDSEHVNSTISTCNHVPKDMPESWIRMADTCKGKMIAQVQIELNAAMTYLAMGAHFSQYHVNRPGFAKFFFESASEEREHAIKIISYLLMRTDPVTYLDELINNPKPESDVGLSNGVTALESALNLEAKVTENIRDIIKKCEEGTIGKTEFNDYHLVDYLSGDFLEEQYKGQRQLAGMISTLKKMQSAQGVLGEYLFDKKLLNNELF